MWKNFHDKLPESHSHKIPARLQGFILQSQLYDRALDLAQKLTQDGVESENGAIKIASVIYKRDVLSVVTDTFHQFLELLQTKQDMNETYQNFETRFDANVCRLNTTCSGAKLPSAVLSFLLLTNSRIDSSQRASILSASCPTEKVNVEDDMKDILEQVSYEKVASVVRDCDEPSRLMQSSSQSSSSSSLFTSNALPFRSKQSESLPRRKQKLTPSQLADLKSKSTCRKCRQKGHWATDLDKCALAPSRSGLATEGNANHPDSGSNPPKQQKAKQKTVTFNMAQVCTKDDESSITPGPLVDDAAPYSGMGIVELRALAPYLLPKWNGSFDPLPDLVKDKPFWQYGNGSHSSGRRRMIGSLVSLARTDDGSSIGIRHSIITGSSQWVIGRNVTLQCNIQHIGGDALRFIVPNSNKIETMSMVGDREHSYLPYNIFLNDATDHTTHEHSSLISLSCSLSPPDLTWEETKKIVEKVHRHVCGHASYKDIKLLLKRNNLWSSQCEKFLSQLLETCEHCHILDEPVGNRKVSLRSMTRSFNQVVCIDHFFPDNLNVLHFMDATTRYSSGLLVPSLSMKDTVVVFMSTWLSDFWPPVNVQGDLAFDNDEFKDYLLLYDIQFRPVPPRRHSKNVLESKHRILRDIYLRLKSERPDDDRRLFVAKMFRISNDLYGNNLASSHELAKGYTRPVSHDSPNVIPSEIIKAQKELSAR